MVLVGLAGSVVSVVSLEELEELEVLKMLMLRVLGAVEVVEVVAVLEMLEVLEVPEVLAVSAVSAGVLVQERRPPGCPPFPTLSGCQKARRKDGQKRGRRTQLRQPAAKPVSYATPTEQSRRSSMLAMSGRPRPWLGLHSGANIQKPGRAS
jgi:hypothetical protein